MAEDNPLFPKTLHAAIIYGMPDSGKTKLVLDLLDRTVTSCSMSCSCATRYRTTKPTSLDRSFVWTDPEVYVVDPGVRLHEWLQVLFNRFREKPTLYVVDDMAAAKALSKKKTKLSVLAMRGRHSKQSLWVLTQHHTGVCKEVCANTKWLALFYTKDRDTFEDICRENDAPTHEERARVKQLLAAIKHSKVIIRTEQPTAYKVLG